MKHRAKRLPSLAREEFDESTAIDVELDGAERRDEPGYAHNTRALLLARGRRLLFLTFRDMANRVVDADARC